MQPTRKDIAELLSLAVRSKLASRELVIAWADSIIQEDSPAPYWAIELSTGTSAYRDELARQLRRVPGTQTDQLPLSLFFALVRSLWLKGRLRGQAVAVILLYALWEYDLPHAVRMELYAVDYAYDLVDAAVVQQQEADAEAKKFLDPYAPYEKSLPHLLTQEQECD